MHDAELGGDFANPHLTFKRPYSHDIFIRQFAGRIPRSVRTRPMSALVQIIFAMRSPPQMSRVAASLDAAGVCCFIPAPRPRPVVSGAHMVMHRDHSAADRYFPIARRASERPNQAIITLMRRKILIKPAAGQTIRRAASERVTVAIPARIMGNAEGADVSRLAAASNGAYSGESHGVHPHVRGQGRALCNQRSRPDFLAELVLRSKRETVKERFR